MTNEILIPEEVKARIEADITALLSGIGTIERIDNAAQQENAGILCGKIKVFYKSLEETRTSLVKPLNENVKSINDYFRKPKARIEIIEANIKNVMLAFQRVEEQIRIEAQRRADEEARKQREEQECKAREKREQEERQRREAEEKRRRAQMAADMEERARLEKEAAKLETKADRAGEAAVQAQQLAATVVPIVVQPVSKPNGFSIRKKWAAQITDPVAFIKWAVSQEKYHLLTIEEKTLNKLVAAEGENFKAPGVRVVQVEEAAIRTKIKNN